MERDFADVGVVQQFVRDFSATLEQKLDRLAVHLDEGDPLGAYDAVLSIATSAAMVGALRLTQAAFASERLIEANDLNGAQRSLSALRACGADTVNALRGTYRPEQ